MPIDDDDHFLESDPDVKVHLNEILPSPRAPKKKFSFANHIEHVLRDARPHQINPKTGELYPWWVINKQGLIELSPSHFDPRAPYTPRGSTFHIDTNPEEVFENPFDLKNLRFIDPEEVAAAFARIREKSRLNQRDPIYIYIGTGGTIAMKKVHGSLTPLLKATDIARIATKKNTARDASSMALNSQRQLIVHKWK